MQSIQSMDQDRKILWAFSTLFLILAVLNVINLIATFAGGELTVPVIADAAATTQQMARISIIIVTVFVALEVLVLVYLGLMGLRQANGKPTGKSHIVIAKICMVFLVLALIIVIISFINAPGKDWIALCSALASVLFCVYYIRAAQHLLAQSKK